MRRMLFGYALVCVSMTVALADVSLVSKENKVIVQNNFYKAQFDRTKGYALTELTTLSPKTYKIAVKGEFIVSADGEQLKYIERYASKPQKFRQSKAKVEFSVVEEQTNSVVMRLKWGFNGGTVIDTITCLSDTPLIRHDVELSFDRIMFEANYSLTANDFGRRAKFKTVFYPDEKRVAGVWNTGFYSACPSWKFAWGDSRKSGLGLIGPVGQGWKSIHYMMRFPQDGWSGDLTIMELQHKALRYAKLPAKKSFSFYLIAGGTPQMATKLAMAQLPKPKDIFISEVWPKKLIIRKDGSNETAVSVVNNSTDEKKIKLIGTLLWGVNKTKVVDTRNLTLQPGDTSKYSISWQGAGIDWGATFRVDAFVDGKLVDSHQEYCAISDFPPAVAGISIINAGQAHQEGSESIWTERFRRSYIGVFEYYCWTPSTIDGLVPKADKWEPHTESQAAYRTTLSKKFLKTLVSDAHDRGLYVYPMITGLFNFQKGLKNPELFQYCENGQPNLYNGKIYKNSRFATGKANAFNKKFAYEWGQEMGRSVDMFGWDGCRWDWNFIPNAPNDPLYASVGGEPDWYNWRGVPSQKLYPNPDADATAALKGWRQGVEENHPEFVYGANGRATAEYFQQYPEYSAEKANKSLLLFEYLLNYSNKKHNTWQKWAKDLTLDCQRVRPHGAQPMVGSMRGLLSGTVSKNLAQYICFASGVKWWSGPALPYGIDKSYKRYRFMVRFSEYYFDNDFMLIPEVRRDNEIKVSNDSRLFWKQFVYEREKDGGRDVTVHLINLPNGDYICQRYLPPPHRNNIEIQVKPLDGEKIVSVYAMLPNPAPHVVKLDVKNGSAILPELIDASIVLFKFKK